VSERVSYARELVAEGHRPAVVARILQISRQAIDRVPKPRRLPASAGRPPADEVEAAIVDVAEANPTDGYRLVCAWVRRRLGRAVNRKRVLRVMRERRLIQRRRPLDRRRRPGFFRVERPDQLWHLDMTSVWVAEHGWVYLMAAIDCCTREIVAWHLQTRCRAKEAIALVERAATERAIAPGTLTLGTDNGSAFTARAFKAILAALGIAHRRGGYRDPESQAFIESWFGKLKERCIWREEFETIDDAREAIGTYVNHYHDRPHSGLDYRRRARSRPPGTMNKTT
jgi:putative transposase